MARIERAKQTADPVVYFGPCVEGNRYPEAILRDQSLIADAGDASPQGLGYRNGKWNSNRPLGLVARIRGAPRQDQRIRHYVPQPNPTLGDDESNTP